METTTHKWKIIRLVYLYLVSLIGLVVLLVGGIELVNTGLKALLNVDANYYGTSAKQICRDPNYLGGVYYGIKAPMANPVAVPAKPEEIKPVDVNSQSYKDCVKEQEEEQKKQSDNDQRRSIAEGLASIILGTPIWLYHWFVIQRDNKKQAA